MAWARSFQLVFDRYWPRRTRSARIPQCRCAGVCRCAGMNPFLLSRALELESEFYRDVL